MDRMVLTPSNSVSMSAIVDSFEAVDVVLNTLKIFSRILREHFKNNTLFLQPSEVRILRSLFRTFS